MPEWIELRVGDHVDFLSGLPFSSELFSTDEGTPLIRIRDLATSTVGTKYNGPFDPRWLVRARDILIGMDGDFSIVKWRNADALLNQRILKVLPKPNGKIDEEFFFYWCGPRLNKIHSRTAATTVKHLSVRDLEQIIDKFPGLAEQRRITEILSTVDETIEQTEALIAKYQQIKAGLMHDLFTRGVTHNGKLRPPRNEAPHLYKKSPLGWIPKEWDIATIDSVSSQVTSGSRGWAAYYSEDGPLFIRIGNLTREHPNLKLDDVVHVCPPASSEGERTRLIAGDVLISITADLGIVGVVPPDFGEAYINQHIALVRLKEEVVNSRWLGHLLAAAQAQAWIRQLDDPGAKAGLNLPTVRAFPIVLPKSDECDEAVSRLDAVDDSICCTRNSLHKLRQLKRGLMHDLLTGRVRVPMKCRTKEQYQ